MGESWKLAGCGVLLVSSSLIEVLLDTTSLLEAYGCPLNNLRCRCLVRGCEVEAEKVGKMGEGAT